ncbi:MAG: NAD(P)-dependent alcohol dehydrogenase [Pseudomonadota bacterium]
MKALTYSRYGPPEVVDIRDVPRPRTASGQVLVRVHASAVNTSDWRIRAAAFPGITALPGRVMFGLLRPRNPRLGSEYAGVVEEVGDGVTRFAVGDRVFGMTTGGGASAEYLAVPAQSAIARIPDGTSFEQAAALPFGGLAALVFLAQFANVQSGQRVLVVGATGGVGAYGVQIAKALGAHVSGVSGRDSQAFLKSLGADIAIDYTQTELSAIADRFDVILDTIGTMHPRVARSLLRPGGTFLPLNMGLREVAAGLQNPFRSRKVRLAVNPDTAEDLASLAGMVAEGKLVPVIDSVFPLEEARQAHAHVEKRHRRGAVILRVRE